MQDARLVAAKALIRLEERGAWSNLSLNHALNTSGLPPRDAAFAGALFYGVIERRLTLDACIAPHSRLPVGKLDAAVLCPLRLGLYQMLYLNNVPERAAVDESVKLAKALGKSQASGYVNGVLRAFLRGGKTIPLPGEPLARLEVEYSCPRELVGLWQKTYGEAPTLRFLRDSLGRAPVAVRVNTLRISPENLSKLLAGEGVAATPHPQVPDCLLLEGAGAPQMLESFRRGLFQVQDVSSQLCALALDARPGHRVLDACAAPGGKTFALAQHMEGKGEVTACDLHEKRVGLIARRSEELELPGIAALCRDMGEPHPELGLFDRVLVDAPCSGYGVIRRKPEIKYKPLADFTNLPNIQYKILETTAEYCKEGALLLYSTCTLNPAENEAVADRFLREHPEFSPRPLGGLLGRESARTLLGEFGGDGFFLAAFQKGVPPC